MEGKDAVLNRLLLNDLTEEERSKLEEQFFTDDELFTRLLEAESDLVDAYVRDELAPLERAAFETRLSASPRLRERVDFARAFGKLPLASRSTSNRTLAFALAASMLLALGGAWLAVDSQRRERGDLLAEQQSLRGKVSSLERMAGEQRARLAELKLELEGRRESATGTSAAAARIASFILTGGQTRDGSATNRLAIPKDTEVLALELPLEAGGYRSYGVSIETAGGRAVAVLHGMPPVRTRENTLRVSLPPSLFPSGDYVLTLSGEKGAAAEPVADYAFRIVKR